MLIYSCARLSLLFLGFLHVSLYQQVDSSLLGHVNLLEPTPVWNTLSICPTSLTNDRTTEKKLLSVVGKGSGLSFTVQIAEGVSEIALYEPHTVNVHGDQVSVFQFIPPQGISDKQLDITATSQSKVAAYLKVSQKCGEVAFQKDLERIDYKKESLRLSFATKGQITLSRVSIPPLTDSVSRWFIGIGLKNLSGDVKLSESKNVTLKLTRSFDYNYATPICVLFFVSFLVGILVSIFAYFLFEESLTKVKVGKGIQGNDNVELKISCCDLWEVIIDHWFSFGPKTYSYVTGIVGAVLMVGAFQFVFANWDTMIQEGDRDNCYYNDFCYRVANHDIPFNLMISNLTYIVHGLILVVWVLILESKVNVRCQSSRDAVEATAMKKRYCFSIGYAFSWGLVFEGLFSMLYHFCPSRFTFQFDSALLFFVAGLIVLLAFGAILNTGGMNFNFFQIFLLFFPLKYFYDVLNSDDGFKKVIEKLFFGFLTIWWFVVFCCTFNKLNIRKKIHGDGFEDEFIAVSLLLGGLGALCEIFIFNLYSDLAQVFLFACTPCSAVAILARARLCDKLSKLKRKFARFDGKCVLPEPSAKNIFQGLFILLTLIISVAAFVVFKSLPTTNKTSSPENSRDQNEECVILGFFDWHDLWHFLSSFAVLMGAFVVMFLSSKAEQSPQAEIRDNTEPREQGEKSAVQAETRVYIEPEKQRKKGANQVKRRGNNEPEAQEKKRAETPA